MTAVRIPLSAPDISHQDIRAVTEVLRSSRLSLGPKLEEFERAIGGHAGAANAVAVSSGTSGLHLCIRALGIGEGDEVIVPSFAFIAVANVVRYEKAVPVFADIEPATLNLDPDRVEAAITPRTKAIVVVHTFGCPADLGAVMEIAKRHSLYVIEDACEAIGAEYKGKKVGTFGDVGVFAFYPNKQITTGEGGAIVTENGRLASLIRRLRNQGRNESDDWFRHTEVGYNYRLSELNCALGCEQLKRVDTILRRREEIAREYSQRLGGDPNIEPPPMTLPQRRISWFAYVVRLSSRFSGMDRDEIVGRMKKRGIELGRYFAPIHQQPAYSSLAFQPVALNVTESIAARVLALPFFSRIRDDQLDEVCEDLTELVRESQAPRRAEARASIHPHP